MQENVSIPSMLLKSLLGGILSGGAVYLVLVLTDPTREAPSAEVVAAGPIVKPERPREVELYYQDRRIDSARDIPVRQQKTTEDALREVYAMSAELRLEQTRALRDRLEYGERPNEAFLEKAGLQPRNPAATIEKIEKDGVVQW